MSIRRRLVVGILILFVAAIVVTDVVTSASLHSFLVGRLDEQLDVAQSQAYDYIGDTYDRDLKAHDPTAEHLPAVWLAGLAVTPSISSDGAVIPAPASGPGPRLNSTFLANRLSPDVYVEVIDASGTVVFDDPSGQISPTDHDPAPVLPAHLPVETHLPAHSFGQGHGPYVPDRPSFEVPAHGKKGFVYRAQAVAIPGGTLVTAESLVPTLATLASLTHVELIVSAAVILALVVLVLATVRFGLRPLDDMTVTAGAIAAGDLTRRVRPDDDQSEVGRLGRALNGMLSQIQAAFDERSRSESRLRRFVADASHELRTPLTSIRGYAELLRKGALDEEEGRRRAALRIEHEAQRMSVLVDDLLLLARLDQGRPLERSSVDLGAVMADAVEAARIADSDRVVSLECGSTVRVLGDPVRLRQVADNLLRNALVHTPPGTPVRVRVDHDATRAIVSVADEGAGIEPEAAGRVFDRFYQGSEARTGSGSGLGLSIVSALAVAHGGRAFVESTPGRGACFVVELPLEEDHQAPPEVRASTEGGAHSDSGARGPIGADDQPGDDGRLARPLRH
ncbi:MAG TPA: HAMP domain-containing sensor histidine kinase [Acidimicrobiales bacterium]|nr:HAMP domain-containing sensor histidine kinase [Acidimicrobiales bacterium]